MKKVLVRCYEPIANDASYRQPWSDVWIRFKARPGRRVYQYGPTLYSHPELHINLRDARDRVAEDSSEQAQADVARLERIDAMLSKSAIYVHADYPEPAYPNIYTTAEWIDRREAEAMLGALMTILGFRRTKFVWKKTRFVIHPVSLG